VISGGVIITSLKNIIKEEGYRGMYRGLSPTIIALLPNWAVYFSVYGKLKDVLQSSGWFSFVTNLLCVVAYA
jgi:solute carrier family 25 folate transporter 32